MKRCIYHASAGDGLEMFNVILNRVSDSRSAQLPTPWQIKLLSAAISIFNHLNLAAWQPGTCIAVCRWFCALASAARCTDWHNGQGNHLQRASLLIGVQPAKPFILPSTLATILALPVSGLGGGMVKPNPRYDSIRPYTILTPTSLDAANASGHSGESGSQEELSLSTHHLGEASTVVPRRAIISCLTLVVREET
jgi:hypothetical protein